MNAKKLLSLCLLLVMLVSVFSFAAFATGTSGTETTANGGTVSTDDGSIVLPDVDIDGTSENGAPVAQIGDVQYATIDEAIAAWTNGKTLTLLADVTLSDVIQLSSTEYHVLDLGTYTMTAASNKDAIQIVNNGRSSASYALDIKADATNPGGITAAGKAIVRTAGKSGVKDRPIIRFYNGVFNASYIVYHSGSNGTNCPQFQFHNGVFNGTIYTNRALNTFYGGTFTGSLMMSVDSSAYTLIAGGTFKQLSNLYMSALNSDKFTIGSAKGVYNKDIVVDENGNYVIGDAASSSTVEASVAKTPGTNDYLAYSKVATEGALDYNDVYTALEKNKTATVTVYTDEIDLTDSSFEGTIVIPHGESVTITNAPDGLKVTNELGGVITPNADGTYAVPVVVQGADVMITDNGNNSYDIKLNDGVQWPDGGVDMVFFAEGDANGMAYVVHEHEGVNYIYVGSVANGKITINNTVGFSTFTVKAGGLEEAFAAAVEGDTIVLLEDATPALTSQRAITKAAVIDLGGNTLTLTEDDLYFGTTTFKNGTIIVDPSVRPSTAVFWMFANQTLTFDHVKLVATGVTGTYLIGLDGNNSDLNLLNGSEIVVENTTALDLDIICVNASTGNDIVIEDSKVNVTNLDGRVFFRGNYTVSGTSNIQLEGITKAGFRIEAGQTLSIEDTASVAIVGEPRDGGIHLTDFSATYTVADTATVSAVVNVPVAVAEINGVKYETLQAAIDAAYAAGGEVAITLVGNVTENVTINEKVGLYLTIDGAGKTWNGKITIKALSDTNDNRRITVSNVNFVNTADTGVDFISSVETNHYPRLSVLDCTFTGNGKDTDVAIRTKSAYDLIIKDCTGTGLHSFLQNTSGVKVTVQNVTVTNSKGGLAMGTAQNVTVRDCDVDTRTYGIRLDAVLDTSVTLNGNVVNAYIPVSVRSATASDYQLTFSGSASSYTPTDADGVWCAICDTEYEEGKELNEATGNVKVTFNTDVLDESSVYGAYEWPIVVVFGDGFTKGFDSLASAMSMGYSGSTEKTIIVKKDITESMDFLEGNIVTDNSNGVTITNTYNDSGYWVYNSESFTIGAGVTYKAETAGLFMYAEDSVINGTVVFDGYYQRYADTKLTINEPGSMTVKTETFILRYTDGDAEAGIYINGDNDEATVGLNASVIYFYQGVISAKNADIKVGTYWQTNDTDGQGSANLVLDNSNMTVTVNEHKMKATGNSTVTLTNGSSVDVAGGYDGVDVEADETSTFTKNGVALFVAQIGTQKYISLQAAINAATGEIVLLADVTENITIANGATIVLNLNGKTLNGYIAPCTPASLTIKNGTVANNNSGYSAIEINAGNLVLENVNIDSARHAVRIDGAVNATVNGGTYRSAIGAGKGTYHAFNISGTATVVIDGGKFVGPAGTTADSGSAINVKAGSSVTINGGDFSGGKNSTLASAGTLTVYGGTFDQNPSSYIAEGYCVVDENGIYSVVEAYATINGKGYPSLEAAVEAAQNGDEIVIIKDIALAKTVTVPAGASIVIDLNGKTVSGVCATGQAHMFMIANTATLTVKDSSATAAGKITYAGNNSTGWIVDVEGKLVLESGTLELTGTWNIGYAVDVRPNAWGTAYTEATTFVMNGGSIVSSDGGVRVASSSADSYANISASFVMNGGSIDAAWDGIFVQQSNGAWDVLGVTINGGTVASDLNPIRFYGPAASSYVNGEDCVDIALNGGTLTYTGTEPREWLVEGIIRLGGGVTASEFLQDSSVAASATFAAANVPADYKWVENANGKYELVAKTYVAQIGEAKYETLDEALAAAQADDEIVLLANVNGDLVLPANVILNGNGKQITGTLYLMGDVTLNGHVKANAFDFENVGTEINIPAGATLELTGTGRMIIGHGCTFNITGSITDAKTANTADLTPSLIIPGASFTGAGVTFNVTNAYIKVPSSYSSSSKSASGTFEFNITNSIWESAGKLAFEEQSVNATVEFNLKDSVLTTGSHLVFGLTGGEVVIDNSYVNVGTSRQLENCGTMTIKNGSVVNGAVATSSNAKNPGTIIVENATYAVTGEFSGSDLGTGTLIIKNGATVSAGSITKANIQIDANGMQAGDEINLTANLSNFAGTVEVVNNDKLEAEIVDGKVVLKRTLSGAGTESDPYIITDLSDLIIFRDSVNAGNNYAGKYVKLNANIDLSSVENWIPIGNITYDATGYAPVDASKAFSGVFDGNGKVISNLKMQKILGGSDPANAQANLGLFGVTGEGAVIKNLTITNVTIESDGRNVAALVGHAHKTVLDNITVNGNIQITGGHYVAGISGMSRTVISATNLAVIGDDGSAIVGKNIVGGITPEIAPAVQSQIFAVLTVENVTISGVGGVGGIVGLLTNAPVSDVSVKDVVLVGRTDWNGNSLGRIRLGIVAGLMGGKGPATVTNVTVNNVTAKNLDGESVILPIIGANYDSSSNATEARIGDKYYATVQAAIAAAQAGDVITIIADVSDVAIEVSKNLTITGSVTLNNVSINAVEGATELTVSGLSFVGNSWINSGAVDKLTVSGVTADVTPSNTAQTNSRSAFISLGRSEQKQLALVIENCNIVVSGGGNPVLGWAQITGATISGNTFGSASAHQTNSDSVKFMAIADGAVLTITGNTVYSDYNGFVFGQNTTRDNAYTVILESNTFIGAADHVWMEVSGSNTIHASVNASSSNTVNGEEFVASDIKVHPNLTVWTSYAGVDVETDANGKVIGGSFVQINEAVIAQGFVPEKNADGTYTVKDDPTTHYINNLDDLKAFRDAVNAGNTFAGVTVYLNVNIDLGNENWTPIGTSANPFCGMFDGQDNVISNLLIEGDKNYVSGGANDNYKGFFGYMKGGNTAGIKNLNIHNAKVTGCLYVGAILGRSYTGGIIDNCHVYGLVQIDGYSYIGGIVGRHDYSADANHIAIRDCSVDGNVVVTVKARQFNATDSYINADYAVSYVGGIVGFMGEGKYIIEGCSVANVDVSGVYGVGGISGIGHYGNEITDASVSGVTVTSTDNDKESARTGNVGLIVGATQGTASEPTIIKDVAVQNTSASATYTDNTTKEITALYGTNMNGSTPVTNYVAEVGGVQYENFADALAAADAGDTITLLADLDLVDATVAAGKNIVIDLNGKTITDAYIVINSDVTIKNGSINNVNEPYPLVVQNGGNLVIDDVAIEASKSDRAIWVRSGGSLVFNSGSILATKGANNTKTSLIAAIYTDTNTDVTINGGTITVDTPNNKAIGIFGNYTNANVTVNGGKISTSGKNYSYGINVDGDITVNGGEIVTNEKGYGYSSGIRYGNNYALVSATGDVTITGGTITTNGYSGYIVNVGRSYSSNDQTVTITGGTLTNNLSEVEQTTGGHKAPVLIWEGSASEVTATITEGNISGFSPALLRGENTDLEVSGGTFDVAINEEYLAEGFKQEQNADGTYGVRELIVKEYEVGAGKAHATLNDAIAQAIADNADIVTYKIYGAVTLETGYSHGIVDFAGTTVTVEGADDAAKLTIVGGGVPDIKGITMQNITFADEGAYLPTANEFMYQNFIDTKFVNVVFEDGIRLSGNCVLTNCTVNANTYNEYAIWMDEGSFEITGTKVTAGNDAYGLLKSDTADTITLTGNTFEYLGKANKEALNTNGATIIASGNTFVDCTAGIVPADKTNYAPDGSTVIDDAAIKQNNVVIIYVAEVNGTKYESLADALAAAKAMTGDVVVKILQKVTLNSNLSGNFDSIAFIGEGEDAEIYLDVQGYITAPGKKVSFADLKLSKSEGGFMNNAGFMNVAFGIYDVAEVNYTNCVFLNGAYASSGKVTYTGCTFYRSHDKYGLWAYGNVDVTVDSCIFADYRGIKMYAEGAAKTVDLTVKNSDFSALTGKPAIVLTYGESVTLAGNTYSATGVFELDLGGAPNGTPVTSTDPITCVNDNGDCGVLANGKIYTTLQQAVDASSTGSTVTLLHNTDEVLVLPAGITLDKNGYTAANVKNAVAQIGNVPYASLQDAIDAAQDNDVITLYADVTLDAVVSIERAITLDLNGKTVTGADGAVVFNVKADVTIQNGSIKGNKSGTSSGLIDIYADLVLNGVNIETSKIYALRFKVGGLTATLTDCNVVGAFKGYGASVWNIVSGTYKASSTAINDQLNGSAAVSGGTFHYEIAAEECAPGYAVVDNGDGTYGAKYAPVAFVDANNNGVLDDGEVIYGSLEAIFEIYQTGDVYIVLTDNVTVTAQVDTDVDAKYYLNTNVAEGVVVNFAFADDWNFIQNMQIGENVTVNAKYLYIWGEVEVSGTVNTDYFYMHGATVTVEENGVVNAATGDATVQVKNGANFTVKGKVNTAILNVWVDGQMVVDGANAKVDASWIDIWDGAPSVSIENGATVETDSIKVSRGGAIALDNGNLNATTVELGHNGTSAGVLTEAGNSTITGEIKMTTSDSVVNSDGGLNNVTTNIDGHMVVYTNGTYQVVPVVATVNGTANYATVQDALDAAVPGDIVTILAGDYTMTLNVNKAITVVGETDENGNLVNIAGKLNITANGAAVKHLNINNGGSTAGYINAKDVLVEGCTVVGGNGFRYCYTTGLVTFKDSTITGSTYGIHFDGSDGGEIVIDNCVITGWTSFAGTIKRVTMTDTKFEEGNYNYVRFYQENIVIEGCTFNEKMGVDIAISGAELDISNSTLVNGNVEDLFDEADMVNSSITVDNVKLVRVARIGGNYYETLEEAFKAATDGCTIEILADVVIDYKWDCRDYATNGSHSQFKESVTINGNGHKITFTGTVNDNNWNTIFRFEENATVNDLTVDISAATGVQRVITAKKSLTVDGLTVIGSAKYGIIFGEGASADDLAATEIAITNSVLTGTRRAISDNEGGKDVKSIAITNNQLSANVYVSASDSVIFTGNTVDGGDVDIRSYAGNATNLTVVAKDNTLDAERINNIIAKNVDAQSEFATKIVVSTWDELAAAIANGTVSHIVLANDITAEGRLVVDRDLRISLNGKNLYLTQTNNRVWKAATLTIDGNGVINVSAVNGGNVFYVGGAETGAGTQGHLVLNNIAVYGENYNTGTNAAVFMLYGPASSTLDINGCEINLKNNLGNGSVFYDTGTNNQCKINIVDSDLVFDGTVRGSVCGDITIDNSTVLIQNCDNGFNEATLTIKNGSDVTIINNTGRGITVNRNGYGIVIENSKVTLANNGEGDIRYKSSANIQITNSEVALCNVVVDDGMTATINGIEVPNGAKVESVNGTVAIHKPVSKIGNVYYLTIEEAINAAQEGETVTILEGEYTVNLTINKGITVVGQGNVTLNGVPSIKGNGYHVENINFVYTTGTTNLSGSGYIKDCTFTATASDGNTFRYCYGAKDGEITFEGCTLTAPKWAIHFDAADGTDLTFINCVINGRVALGADLGSLTATGTKFENGYVNVWGTEDAAIFTDCEFVNIPYVFTGYDADNVVKFSDCTVVDSGNANAGITDIIYGGIDNVDTLIYVNDVLMAGGVAKIGDVHYQTLQAAIDAAQAGDTITLVGAVNENVTVGKSLIIDGQDNNYTGTMTISKSINLTVQNVNFVEGNIVKGKSTGTSGTYTIVGCDFTSQAQEVYAIVIRGSSAIVIEDCTANGYFGFLQIPSSNNSVSLKNVSIENSGYAVKVDYSNGVSMDNVKITNSTYGFVNSNFGTKTITVKNCTITADYPLVIWDRGTALTNTFVFEGANDFGSKGFDYYDVTDAEKAYTKYVLSDEYASLKTVENLEVSTSANGFFMVVYRNGAYCVVPYVATIGEAKYETLQEAVDAAQAGDVITVVQDITLNSSIVINDGTDVTIEGNGITITGGAGVDVFYVKGGKLTLAAGLNVHATTDCAIYIRGGDVFTAANLTKSGNKYHVIQGNGNYVGNVTITGGEVTAPAGQTAIYWPQNGKLTITGGTITGYSAVYINSGSLEITGGTLHGVGPAGEYEGANGGSYNAPGEALTIEAIGGNSGYEMISSIVITGGTFISDNAAPIGTYANTGSNPEAVAILNFLSGGTFNKAVPENFCAAGFIPVPDANGNYIVKEGKFVVRNTTTGVGYETLQAAIDAATAGDVISFIEGLSESVTVSKSLTIDGQGKSYTATIAVSGNVNVTVQNVRFDKGSITYSGSNMYCRLTVKDCSFQDGGYAITTKTVGGVIIENCKVFNQSLLYAPRSTHEIIVRDVTILSGNYGANIAYGNTAVFENVTMVDVKYGIHVHNYGTKTITLENCDIRGNNPIYTWERNTTVVDTFKIVGATKLVPTDPATFAVSQYAKIVLADESATLEAPANLAVTEGVEHPCYKVVYENGIYKVILEHTVVIDAAVAPDCENTGLTEGSHCSVCGEVFVAQQEVPATDHTWVEATVDAPKHCEVCGVIEGEALKAVASINGVKYPSIQAAVDAAQDGDTVVIESDVTLVWDGVTLVDSEYAAIVRVAGKSITVDLNGHKLTGNSDTWATKTVFAVFAADEGGALTLTGNGTIEVTGQTAAYSLIMAYEDDTYITIENGNYYLETAKDSLLYAGGYENVMTVNGGNFKLGNVGTSTNGSPWIINVYGKNYNYVVVNGGTFNSDICHQFWANEVFVDGEKYALQSNGEEGTWSIVPAVAYIEKIGVSTNSRYRFVGYATIEEALAAAKAGDTITLVQDIALEAGIVISADDELTIDLNGHTMSMSVAATATSALITNNGTLTITDSSAEQTGKLTYFSSTTSTGYSTSTIINNGTLTVESGTIENTSASGAPYAVDNYNTLTVNGGNFVAKRNVIRQAQFGNHDNIVTINGGTFTGYAGLQLHVFSTAKKTETIINGGTFNGTYAMYTSFYTAEASANTSITVNDGTFNGDYAIFLYNSNAGAADHAFTAAINGGTFNAPVYVYVNDAEGNTKYLPVISGGTFADDSAAVSCVEGFGIHANADGTYGVHQHVAGEAQQENYVAPQIGVEGSYDMVVRCTVCNEILSEEHFTVDALTAAASINGVNYSTIEEALAAAPAGSTITLMSDVTYTGGLILTNNLTLDLNGNDFTVHGALVVLKGSSLVDAQNGVGKIYVDNEYSLIVSDEDYDPEKAMLPVWMPAADGEEAYYTLVKVVAQHQGTAENNAFYFKFRPAMVTSDFTADVFADGGTNNGLSIEIYIRCYKDGAEVEHLHYVVSEEQIIASYSQGKAIGLYIHGATADIADKYVVSYVVKSHRGITHEVKEAFVYEPVVAVSSDEE